MDPIIKIWNKAKWRLLCSRSYVPDPIYIKFYQDGTLLSRLNRSTLEWADKKCILLDENDNIKSRLDKVLENIENKAKAKNKI